MDVFDIYGELMEKASVIKDQINFLARSQSNKEEIIRLIQERSDILARCDQLYVSLSQVA